MVDHDYISVKREIIKLSYTEMVAYLTNEDTRIIDYRILDIADDFTMLLQYLCKDGKVRQVEDDEVSELDLFKLSYFNNRRNNPLIWGLLDKEKDNGK